LKDLIYQGRIFEKYRERITLLLNKEPDVFSESVNATFSKPVSRFIIDKTAGAKWCELEKRHKKLRWNLLKKNLFERPLCYCFDSFLYLLDRSKKYLFQKTGIFLVLLGPDGSGKSTVAEHILKAEVLQKLFMNKRYFHSRFDFLPPLRKYFAFCTKTRIEHSPKTQQIKSYGMFRAMIYPVYYGMSYFLGHPLLWKEKACSGLVVFDRYFYDFLIQRELIKCPKWVIQWIGKLIPKPNIIIFLKTKPEIIYKRKQELTIDEIKRQNKVCEEFIAGFQGAVSIDASSSVEKIVNQIKLVIIEKVKEKQKI
jgi:thymidylate kinase